MAKKKAQKKPQKPIKVHTYYSVKGSELETKNKTCPKCGDGVFLAQHKDRLTCGKCSYMQKI
jgi:ubiquitin-small subunit ribosomal protein S27Ae